jgi:hypothetical protein
LGAKSHGSSEVFALDEAESQQESESPKLGIQARGSTIVSKQAEKLGKPESLGWGEPFSNDFLIYVKVIYEVTIGHITFSF